LVYFKNKSDIVPRTHADVQIVGSHDAQQLVYSNIHQTMRSVNTDGINWLQSEQSQVQTLLKSTGIMDKTTRESRTTSSNSSTKSSDSTDLTKKKLGLFLGTKK